MDIHYMSINFHICERLLKDDSCSQELPIIISAGMWLFLVNLVTQHTPYDTTPHTEKFPEFSHLRAKHI